MATIAREKNGTVRIWFVDAAGKRKGIRIGKASEEYAELFKLKLEDLVTATVTNTSPALNWRCRSWGCRKNFKTG